MNKKTLDKGIAIYKAKGKEAIEDFLSELNHGQRQKILRKENIRKHCEIFGVEYSTDDE